MKDKDLYFSEHFRNFLLERIEDSDYKRIEKTPSEFQDYLFERENECYKRGFIDGIRLATE